MEESALPNDVQQKERRCCSICRIYATILANGYPFVLVGVLAVSITCACVSFVVYDLPSFEEPTKGFQARDTPITTSIISYHNYIYRDYGESESSRRRRRRDATPPPSPSTVNASAEPSSSSVMYDDSPDVPMLTPNLRICVNTHPAAGNPSLTFGASGNADLFTAEALKSACQLEEEVVRSHAAFSRQCIPCYEPNLECPDSWSLGGYVALLSNKASCDEINATDVATVKTLLHTCAKYYLNGSLPEWCNYDGLCNGVPEECQQHSAVYPIFNYVVSKRFVEDLRDDEDARLKLMAIYLPLNNDDYWTKDNLRDIYVDNIHGKTFSSNNVVLKAVKFNIKFLLFDEYLFSDIIYVGIGLLLILIIVWVYTTSFLVMLANFFNFIMSLILAYFVYVVVLQRPFFPFVNITALILLIGIGADDTFVYMDLWRKALSNHRGGKLVVVVEDAISHATATMFVTSATTSAALFASMFSQIPAVKCFALFSGIAILMNFVLTLSWLPAVIILQHRLMKKLCTKEPNQERKESKLECLLTPFRVFYDKILPFIVVKFQYVWLVTLTLLGIAGAIVVLWMPGLKLPTSSEFQILRGENYLEQYDLVYKNHFRYEETGEDPWDRMKGIVLFGIKSTYNGDIWDPDKNGEVVYDDSFEFSAPEHQLWLDDFCQDLKQQSFYHSDINYGHYTPCSLDPLKEFMSRDCAGGTLSPCCNESTFPYPASTFNTCLKECSYLSYCHGGFAQYTEDGDRLRAFGVSFYATTFITFDFNIMQTYWNEVNGWMMSKFATAPGSLSSTFFTSENRDQLWFFDLQLNLASGTRISLGVTLAIATVILIITILNVLLALYAILSVAFVVFVTMGSLVLLGWELNIFESIIFTLAVGLSVDFTIHYGVAYSFAPFRYRSERTEYSLQTMASAITIATISTFIAGALMLPATVNAYLQLGIFMMLVMSISWVYSTLYFQSLCNLFGPQGRVGQLTYCCTSDDDPYGPGNKEAVMAVQNGGSSRENSQRIATISGDGVQVGDINMKAKPPALPPNLPGIPLKNSDDDSEQGDGVQLHKPNGTHKDGITNPTYDGEIEDEKNEIKEATYEEID